MFGGSQEIWFSRVGYIIFGASIDYLSEENFCYFCNNVEK